MNIKTPRSIARLALIGGLAASGAVIVPSFASAGCTGEVFQAKANNSALHGTGCNDTFKLGQFSNVRVYAGGGDDTVRAGFSGSMNYINLEGGNDTVVNPNDNPVWVDGGSGNDNVTGSSGYDAFYGGSGTDTFKATPGDFYQDVEIYS